MTRRQLIIGVAILLLVQAVAVAIYMMKRGRSADTGAFAVETLSARPAPDLTFQRRDGSRDSLASLRGKVVLVHFWGTWCEPCRDELPGLLALVDSVGIEMLAVAIDDDWEAITRFFAGTVPRLAVRPDGSDIHRQFGASTLPDTYLVNSRGELVLRYAGARDWRREHARDALVRAIEQHR